MSKSSISDYLACNFCDSKSEVEHTLVTTRIRVTNLCCAGEEAIILSAVTTFRGVESVNTNVVGRYCLVKHCPEMCCAPAAAIVDKLNSHRLGASIQEVHDEEDNSKEKGPSIEKNLHAVFISSFFVAAAVSEYGYHAVDWGIGFYAINIFFGSIPVLKKAFEAIYYQNTVNIHVLMTVAIVGAIAINDVKDAAIVVTLFILAELLEEHVMHVVRNAIKLSAKSFAKTAILAQSGEQVSIDSLTVGERVAVRAGDMIPVDGTVTEGSGVIDESALTGEATPVAKRAGAKVISGTVLQNGYLEVLVDVEPQNSTLRRMNQVVEDVQADRGKFASVVDNFATYWTPLILVVSFLFFIIASSVTGEWQTNLYRALVLLVLACPCAVVLAAPIACVCGIAGAAKYGVLIRGSSVIEMLGLIDVVAVDKTGTLTEGFFSIIDQVSLATAAAEKEREALHLPKIDALQLAAAVETKSAHPLANAIVAGFCGCIADMDPSKLPNAVDVKVIDGVGLQGMVTVPGTDDIVCVVVGNERLFRINGGNCELTDEQSEALEIFSAKNKSCTIVVVSIDDRLELALALGDNIRAESAAFINKLKSLNCEVSMLTGDHKDVAQETCRKLGIKNCHARLLPENKLQLVEETQRLNHHVLMLGDGINDATALAGD
jgi:Cd2+/Zn2+-exporting ATPase